MPALQGLYTFPGVKQPVSGTYTLAHGITPGVATLEMAPQAGFVGVGGALVFAYGPVRIVIPNLIVDQSSVRYTGSGQVWALQCQDRRWKWRYGRISGLYNDRDASNQIVSPTSKTPQQLAVLCLQAMGEQGYDVSQLPNSSYPYINWDREVPATALANLCDLFGCRVVLRLDNTVQICKTGVGSTPPTQDLMEAQSSITPPQRPDRLEVVCGKTRYQNDWALVAMGRDTDGTIKAIDNLSYAPKGGWTTQGAPLAGPWPPGLTGQAQQLARQTVYRWYGLANYNNDGTKPLKVPGYPGQIEFLDQVHLEDTQCAAYPDPVALAQFGLVGNLIAGVVGDAANQPLPARVYGTYYPYGWPAKNTPPNTLCDFDFRYLPSEQVIEFGDYVFMFQVDNHGGVIIGEADLYLRCAATIQELPTFAWSRYTQPLVLGGKPFGTGPRVLKHDEIVLQVIPSFDQNGKLLTTSSNQQQVSRECDYALQAAALEYQLPQQAQGTYAGLIPIALDGSIQEVTWTVGPSGTTTRAGLNNEYNPAVPSYGERRQAEQLRAGQLQDALRQIQELRDKQQQGR